MGISQVLKIIFWNWHLETVILKLECADIRSTLAFFKPRIADFLDHWVWGDLRICISSKFPGDVAAAGPDLREPLT